MTLPCKYVNMLLVKTQLTTQWLFIMLLKVLRILQPQEEGEARDVQVPLRSKQLHMHMVNHVRVHLRFFIDLRAGVFPHLPHSIYSAI